MQRRFTYRLVFLLAALVLFGSDMAGRAQWITTDEASLIEEVRKLRKQDQPITALHRVNDIIDNSDDFSTEAVARAFFERGLLYNGEDSPDFALRSFSKALPLFEDLDSHRDLQSTHLELGMLRSNAGQAEIALEHYETALSLESTEHPSPRAAELQLMIGELYIKMEQFTKAQHVLESALPQFEALNSRSSWNECALQLLVLHEQQQTYNMGRSLAYDAYKVNVEQERWKDAQIFTSRLSEFNEYAQRIPEAIQAQEKAVELAIIQELPDTWAAHMRLGELYSIWKQPKQAEKSFAEALRLAVASGDLFSQRLVTRAMGYHHHRHHDSDTGFKLLSYSDSLQMQLIARANEAQQAAVQPLPEMADADVQYPISGKPWYLQPGYLISAFLSSLLGMIGWFWMRRRHKRQIQVLRWKLFKRTREMHNAQEDLTAYIHRSSLDLRNPLINIQGMLRVLRSEEHSLNTRKALRMIETSSDQMDKILINLSKALEYQKQDVRVERVDFRKLREELQAEYIQQPGGVELIWEFQETAPFYSDPHLLKVILVHTMRNSIQYRSGTDSDYCKISLYTNERGAVVQVQDNGVGISDKVRENIFGMFVKGSAHSEGTGLGLYLVRLACEKVHGKLDLTTTVREGSTLKFTLPNLVQSENRGELPQESNVILEEST